MVGPVEVSSTKVGLCFHHDPTAVGPAASRTPEEIWVLPPAEPIRVESCHHHDPLALGAASQPDPKILGLPA